MNLTLAERTLVADVSGAIWWPDRSTLLVADLHFEKGSAFAARGAMLPPYDTRATLDRLAQVLARYRPEQVICLGDSFHDDGAGARMDGADQVRLEDMVAARDWVWIVGNHDPHPPARGGRIETELAIGGLVFRHEALLMVAPGEVSGHFHPAASISSGVKRITRPCFVTDGRRLILPAFGAYTGGLNVLDPAFGTLFPDGFMAHVLGRDRLHSYPSDNKALRNGSSAW